MSGDEEASCGARGFDFRALTGLKGSRNLFSTVRMDIHKDFPNLEVMRRAQTVPW
jgi:hypothetical protein